MTPEERAALCDWCYRKVPLNNGGSHHTTRDNESTSWGEWPCAAFSVHNFILAAIAEEREACAKRVENVGPADQPSWPAHQPDMDYAFQVARRLASAIRARP